MSTAKFEVISHLIDGQHIREYPDATRHQGDIRLKVHIKQYKPRNNLIPKSNSITIIALHGNGFPKELYEPLWDELLERFNSTNLHIRSIWIADTSNQGASGIANEETQGDDASYMDVARDLLHMVNVFRNEMVVPIFGIGHSMGAAHLAHLCYLHPRLLHSVALIEPVIQTEAPVGPVPSMFAAVRPDLFWNRKAAESGLRLHPMFKALDMRVLKLYTKFGFRNLPTRLYPDIAKARAILEKASQKSRDNVSMDKTGPMVTLTTTKHQEAWTYARANLSPLPSSPHDKTERLLIPDLDSTAEGQRIWIRPEFMSIVERLPELRPATLWLYGETSFINTPEIRAKKACTGTGRGGSGGLKSGRVQEIVVPGAGHMLPLEKISVTAEILTKWMTVQRDEWCWEKAFYKSHNTHRSSDEGLRMSREFREAAMDSVEALRPLREKL